MFLGLHWTGVSCIGTPPRSVLAWSFSIPEPLTPNPPLHTHVSHFIHKTMKPTTLLRVCIAVLLLCAGTATATSYPPGVIYPCDGVTELSVGSGSLSYSNEKTFHTECWHIACEGVSMRIPSVEVFNLASLHMYSSVNGSDFLLKEKFNGIYEATNLKIELSGSVFVQFRSGYWPGRSAFDLYYVCTDIEVPPPLPPGAHPPCNQRTDLSDAGNVSYSYTRGTNNYHIECWYFACEKHALIRMSSMQLFYPASVQMYSSVNDTLTRERSFHLSEHMYSDFDVVLSGSAYIQFISGVSSGTSTVNFDYMCVDATPAPTTEVPATRTPGVFYPCDEHTNLNDAAGNMSFTNNGAFNTECYTIACDNDVVVRFSANGEYYHATAKLYTSPTGTNFGLAKSFFHSSSIEDIDIVLSGHVFVQFRGSQIKENSVLRISYMCLDADVPPPLPPGAQPPCNQRTELSDAGNVSYSYTRGTNNYHIECWYLACEKHALIRMSSMQLFYPASVQMYSSVNDTLTRERSFHEHLYSDFDVVLSGSAYIQFVSGVSSGTSTVNFDYMCVDATPAPTTEVPATRTPGVFYPCDEHTNLNDAAGNMSFTNKGAFNTECYNIACDKDMVVRFSANTEYYQSTVQLYTSPTGTDFRLAHGLFRGSPLEDVDIVLSGHVFVQFRGSHITEDSVLDINYVCTDATSPAPLTDVPDVPHSCNEVGHNVGQVSFVSDQTECWHIACDTNVVLNFAVMELYDMATVQLYTSVNGAGFTLKRKFTKHTPRVDRVVLNGSIFVQFDSPSGTSSLEFDYVCEDGTSPPTNAPQLATDIPVEGSESAGGLNLPNYLSILFPCLLVALIMS